ncbi:hypothetical protein RHMOL_Rhmol06G0288900 [Rhododendron molle]|uniref:Uncharacterized protein n=1 Tax=Rhododendron molle TaxID=49168 RepID=A0ACC0NI94_RHOML|nr:hypothetical protein RHMOL_Rhmol06G0288900 [Rhododendron molle]
MGPGSRKSSASSNSSIKSRGIAEATTSVPPPIVASTPSIVPSPSTGTSVVAAPSRRVRGPTLGKRVRRLIEGKDGTRLRVYVTQEMRTFCGANATKVANELGSQIRRMCRPTADSFCHSWKLLHDQVKRGVIQAVRDKFEVTENGVEFTPLVEEVFDRKANLLYKDWKWRMSDHYEKTNDHYERTKEDGKSPYQLPFTKDISPDAWKFMIDHIFKDPDWQPRKLAGKKNRNHPVDGFSVASRGHTLGSRSFAAAITIEADKPNGKVPDLCEVYQASHTLKDGGWIDPQCAEIHARMVAARDEASEAGCPLTDEELSRIHLGEAKYYIRGFGVGPRPSSFSSRSSSNSSNLELQKVQSELELLREDRQREREENEKRWEEEERKQREREEQQRQRDEELRELRLRDEQRQREFDELKAMMMRHMHGRDNVRSM